ncbi:MAG: imidazole glycerol phosphate synthase subunit HisH, partial [Nitrospirota bacterium]
KVVRFDFSTPWCPPLPRGELKGGVGKTSISQSLKVPHMGWNAINIKQVDNPLFNGIPDKSYFYFVHSYYVAPEEASIILTTTDYGIEFTSSVRKGNIFGVQFHPEKSQAAGLQVLRNFGEIAKKGVV